MGKTVTFKRPDGGTVEGYLAETNTAADAPAIVVLQEWWGLNDQIRGVAERFAAAGYTALVPDLYRGKSTVEAAEAEHLMTNLNFADAAGQDVAGAVAYLKAAGAAKVGVTGYCMGGALTLLSAVNVPDADAAVVWYGYPPLEYVDASKIKVPMLGHFAVNDAPFPIANVDKLEEKLRAAGVEFEFHRYDAMHAFANETQVGEHRLPITEYNPQAAHLAWTRTLGFFERTLR
jgi:carboxymethylenebutenolidase